MNKLEFKEFRKKYNLSLKEVADITKVTVRAVMSWDNGTRNMSQSAIGLLDVYVKNISKEADFIHEEGEEYNIVESVGNRLAEYAEMKGVSIKEFAARCDIGYNNTTSLFKGRLPLGMNVLHKIKKAFPNLNTEWVIYDNGEMEINKAPVSLENNKEVEQLEKINYLLSETIKDKEKTISGLEKQIALMEKLQEVTKTEESPVKSHVGK